MTFTKFYELCKTGFETIFLNTFFPHFWWKKILFLKKMVVNLLTTAADGFGGFDTWLKSRTIFIKDLVVRYKKKAFRKFRN